MTRVIQVDELPENLHYCPYCKTITSNAVTKIACMKFGHSMESLYFKNFYMLDCNTCGKHSILVEKVKMSNKDTTNILSINKKDRKGEVVLSQKFIYPVNNTSPKIPSASDSMPEDVKSLYNEAASVFELSPRSSAALVRLSLETLLKKHLVNDGKKHDFK